MADLISKNELYKKGESLLNSFINGKKNGEQAFRDLFNAIADMPTVDTERHGHWYIDEQKNIWGDYVNCQVCSVCNKRNIDCDKKSDYCPNCGAKMDEVTE